MALTSVSNCVGDFRSLFFSATLLWLAGTLPALSSPSARAAVEAGYKKSCEAASLMYLDGMLSMRSFKYTGYGTDGKIVDPKSERVSLERLISTALRIKESSKLLSFKQTDAGHASCQVQDTLEIAAMGQSKEQTILLTVETISADEWENTARGWRQVANHVTTQSFKTREFIFP